MENNSKYILFKNHLNKTLVYYPCPKNANTSAKLFFAKHAGYDDEYIFLGDKIPQYRQREIDFQGKRNLVSFLPSKQKFMKVQNVDITCCLIRNPIERFVSAFKNRIIF